MFIKGQHVHGHLYDRYFTGVIDKEYTNMDGDFVIVFVDQPKRFGRVIIEVPLNHERCAVEADHDVAS